MALGRSLFLRASRSRWLARQMSRRAFVQRAVRRFMPGETLEAALAAAVPLAEHGIRAVITQLGENLTSLAEADAVREHYLGACDAIRARGLDCWPSVKPTQLGLDLSTEACLANLDAVAARAAAVGSMLWIDMEDSSYVDRTLALYRALRAKYEGVGVCLQAYLRRTPDDVAALLPLRPAIRLVKGAYAEPPHVALPAKRDTDAAFEAIGRTLLDAAARRETFVVLGTHDVPLIRRLARHARAREVPDDAWETHMLYGIRAADQVDLARAGRRVRTLIAYGTHWFPWYMRRLAERPANVWFVMKALAGSREAGIGIPPRGE
jgi:proline dehydrogenase